MNDLFEQCIRFGAKIPGKAASIDSPKIRRLTQLSGKGFRVPDGWVIPETVVDAIGRKAGLTMDFSAAELAQRLFLTPGAINCLRQLWEVARRHAPLILRSAVDQEDQTAASFAGIYRSVNNINNLDELVQAFAACWIAAHSSLAERYARFRLKIPQPVRLSLLLQEYIEGDLSGVTFTVDPLSPVEHELKMEVGPGPCELITSGTEAVSSWCFDWRDQQLRHQGGHAAGINPDRLLAVAGCCLDIQRFFGAPQDIEWTMRGDELFILQSRPVGSLRLHDQYIWTNANFRDGGIGAQMPSPLMWSLYSFTFENAIERFTQATSLVPDPKPERWTRTFFGYPYWNLTSTKAGSQKVLGYVERQFDKGQGVDPYYEGDGYVARFSLFSLTTSLRALLAITRSIRSRFRRSAEARDYFQQEVLRRFESISLETLTLKEATDYLAHLIERDLLFLYGRYWEIIYDNTFLNNFLLNSLERYCRRKKLDIDFTHVVSAIDDVAHIRPLQALWELRERIVADPAARQFWEEHDAEEIAGLYLSHGPLPYREAFADILLRFRYKSEHELEINVPDWIEDPAAPVRILQGLLAEQTVSPLEKLQRQQRLYQESRQMISRRSLLKKIDRQRRLLWWKEEIRDLTTHHFHLIRRVVCRLEECLLAEGRLSREGDIFFLSFPQVLALARGTDEKAARETIHYNRIIFESFRCFAKPNLVFPETTAVHTPEAGSYFQGIGVSPGIIRGQVLLVADPGNNPEGLTGKDEKVLVTNYLNPSHLPLFNRTRAVVTANGGMLSHGAIICREFGIPAVFGISGILDTLQEDDWIEIDGQAGTVKILSHAETASID